MEDLIWGLVPTQRTRKEEKFNTPVLTLAAIDKIGAGRKFIFNKAAQSALNIEGKDRVVFGFGENRIFVKKAKEGEGFELTQTCTLSDKKTYEYIAKQKDLKIEEENNFDLVLHNVPNNVWELIYRPMVGDMEGIDFLGKNVETIAIEDFADRDLGDISDAELVETFEPEQTVDPNYEEENFVTEEVPFFVDADEVVENTTEEGEVW